MAIASFSPASFSSDPSSLLPSALTRVCLLLSVLRYLFVFDQARSAVSFLLFSICGSLSRVVFTSYSLSLSLPFRPPIECIDKSMVVAEICLLCLGKACSAISFLLFYVCVDNSHW